MKSPRTLQEAIVYFADSDRAFDYAVSLRWPEGKAHCPRCSSEKNSFIKTRRIWFCWGCKQQFTLKVNTIFEDSPLGLDKWMTAFWMLVNCKNGIFQNGDSPHSWHYPEVGMVHASTASHSAARPFVWLYD